MRSVNFWIIFAEILKHLSMEKDSNCIRFDWAAKYILRNKADFVILEGLVSTVIGEKISIVELLGT